MTKEFKNSFRTTTISNSQRIKERDIWKKHLNPEINMEYHRLKLGYGLKKAAS